MSQWLTNINMFQKYFKIHLFNISAYSSTYFKRYKYTNYFDKLNSAFYICIANKKNLINITNIPAYMAIKTEQITFIWL